MRREANLILAIEFLLKNRILPEAPAIDGNIVGDRNTLRTCRAKCSNVTWRVRGSLEMESRVRALPKQIDKR